MKRKIWFTTIFMCFLTFFSPVRGESYWAPVSAVIDESFLESVRYSPEPLGDGGRLYIPEVGIDVGLYRVRFINLDPIENVMEEPEPVPEVMELPSIDRKEIDYTVQQEVIHEEPESEWASENTGEEETLPAIQAVQDSHPGVKKAEPMPSEEREAKAEPTPSEERETKAEPMSSEERETKAEPMPSEEREEETEPVSSEEEAEPVSSAVLEVEEEPAPADQTEEDFWIDLGLAQVICDEWDSAVWLFGMRGCGNIIADHASQGFDGIKAAHQGTMAYLKTVEGIQLYVCVDILQGHNTGTYLTDNEWNRLMYNGEGSLVMYTCNENWENITIALWQRVEAWVE